MKVGSQRRSSSISTSRNSKRLTRNLKPRTVCRSATSRSYWTNKILIGTQSDYAVSVAGWAVFAHEPQTIRKFRNAATEFQIFRGNTREAPLRKQEFRGPLPQQFESTLTALERNIWVIPKVEGGRRKEVPAYERESLREVVSNALVHRDYRLMHQPVKIALFSDRLEVENPGGLLPGLTPFNLFNSRRWRNPVLAEAMKKTNCAEMDGQGIDRIYAATRRVKIPAAQFIDDGHTFKAVLSAPKHYDDFTPEEKRLSVVVLLITDQKIDNEAVRNAFDIDRARASTLLKSLVEEGIIEPMGKSRKFAAYRLSKEYVRRLAEVAN
jgi:ATP-dependent DNA helicase RecG